MLSVSSYSKLSKSLKKTEENVINTVKRKHANKIHLKRKNSKVVVSDTLEPCVPTISKPIKHNDTIKGKRIQRNRKRRKKDKEARNHRLSERLKYIKDNGLVVNFSSIDIPDGAILFLAKGNSFVPSVTATKHDIVYDTSEFLRKLAWRTHFHSLSKLPGSSSTARDFNVTEEKLRLQSHEWPSSSNKLYDHVANKIRHFIDTFKCSEIKKFNNLTYMERQGLHWCIKMQKDGKLHFSQADKGGATVIMDPNVVNDVILSKLRVESKFEPLVSDPRSVIDSNLLSLCKRQLQSRGMSEREVFLVTGHTGKGKSHNPAFKAGKPNPFPLFKLHSLSTEEIATKTIPPVRLVTSMKFSATKRLSVFIDSVLNPVAKSFCGKQFIKDTPDLLRKLAENENLLCANGSQLFTLDVKSLYPSINPTYVPMGIAYALDVATDFSAKRKKTIISLVEFSISNACVHYRDKWYRMKEGIPTGGSDSVVIANIYVKWILLQFNSSPSAFCFNPFVSLLFRFIDDIFGCWTGTYRQFKHFIELFNKFGSKYGVVFDKDMFGDSVNFLDVLISNTCGSIITDLFIKPTDARRYLHRNSFHPKHTFSSIPFSQMRRAALICSNEYLRDYAIDAMIESFVQCGYKKCKLLEAKDSVQQLKRDDLLKDYRKAPSGEDPLVFVLPFSVDVRSIRQYISQFEKDIQLLTGVNSVVFSFKRNANTSSMLFNKFGFAQSKLSFTSQKCGGVNCSSCMLKRPDLSWVDIDLNFTLKPSKFLNCKSECVIYAAICKLCSDFYIGKTMCPEHVRMNGHRDKFHPDKYDKSALSMHIYIDHPEFKNQTPTQCLANYQVILVETTSAVNLRQREHFYIWITQAELRHLNRYKVSR